MIHAVVDGRAGDSPRADAVRSTAAPTGGGKGSMARGGSLNVLGSLVTAGANFGLVLLLSRSLGATGSGQFLIAVAIFQILSRTAELGVSTGLVRWIAQARADNRIGEIDHAHRVSLLPIVAVGAILGGVSSLSSDWLAGVFASGEAERDVVSSLIRVMGAFVPISAVYAALVNGARGYGTMKVTVAIDKIAKPVLQLAALAVVIGVGAPRLALALAWVMPVALLGLPTARWSSRLLGQVEAASSRSSAAVDRQRREIAHAFWSFTLPRSLASIFQVAVLWLDTVLVGAVLDTEAAGVYTTGVRYLMVGTFLGLAVSQAIQPLVSAALGQGERAEAGALFQTATSWLAMVVVPLYVAVAVFSEPLLRVFGSDFVAASPALVVLSIATIVGALCGPVDTVLLMGGRSTSSLANMGLALGANIVLNLLLIPPLGITGAGVAFAASILIGKIAPLVQVYRSLGLHPFGPGTLKVISLCAVTFVPIVVFGRWFAGDSLLVAVGSGTAGSVVYAVGLFLARGALQLDEFSGLVRRPAAARAQNGS